MGGYFENGAWPCANSNAVIPNDQMSALYPKKKKKKKLSIELPLIYHTKQIKINLAPHGNEDNLSNRWDSECLQTKKVIKLYDALIYTYIHYRLVTYKPITTSDRGEIHFLELVLVTTWNINSLGIVSTSWLQYLWCHPGTQKHLKISYTQIREQLA